MALISTPGKPSKIQAGFQDEAVPGSNAGGGDVGLAVGGESRKYVTERVYNGLARTWKLTNRAEKGAMKGKPFMTTVAGEHFPEGALGGDRSTWLQPGESMLVSRDVATYICGNVFDPFLPDRGDMIRRYGDWEFEGISDQGLATKAVALKVIGPPRYMPDLIVEQVDGRGRDVGEPVAMWELYTKGQRYLKARSGYTRQEDEDDESNFEA